MNPVQALVLFLALLAAGSPMNAQERAYSPYVEQDWPPEVFWGDTHVHTNASMDAGAFGNRLDLEQAYRFARGEQVESTSAGPVRLSRPLDFLVVADHAENLGLFPDLYSGAPHILADPTGKRRYERIQAGDGMGVALELISLFSQDKFPPGLVYSPDSLPYQNAWARAVQTADRYNEPGQFTALIGYEWTSLIRGNNLHRVVVYRDGANKAGLSVPFTSYPPAGSRNPRDLWAWMEKYEAQTGGDVLAIPHNGNLSNGMMFPMQAQSDSTPIDMQYLRRRTKWEPLYEATQIKGDGEAHPFLSPADEYADYETWDKGNLDLSQGKSDNMLAGEYAREALKRGLVMQATRGINPYQFGLIGSTDSHTSLATAQEDNYFGKHTPYEPSPERVSKVSRANDVGTRMAWKYVASGLAAVWATDNSREALFDAMERRETYATTGSRMRVRIFGGWSFAVADLVDRQPAAIGYEKGVPMGGVLPPREGKLGPQFMLLALRDPIGANLDRIQIVKGWYDGNSAHEKVYNVAWSGDRQPGKGGRLPPVGNTIDVASATWTNSIGAPALSTVWTDPDFDPTQNAFYYARVLEIPTPRWSTYDAARFGVKVPEGAPVSTQERAYTAPIWYRPLQSGRGG